MIDTKRRVSRIRLGVEFLPVFIDELLGGFVDGPDPRGFSELLADAIVQVCSPWAVSRVRDRFDALEADVAHLEKHHPKLLRELREIVCEDEE